MPLPEGQVVFCRACLRDGILSIDVNISQTIEDAQRSLKDVIVRVCDQKGCSTTLTDWVRVVNGSSQETPEETISPEDLEVLRQVVRQAAREGIRESSLSELRDTLEQLCNAAHKVAQKLQGSKDV